VPCADLDSRRGRRRLGSAARGPPLSITEGAANYLATGSLGLPPILVITVVLMATGTAGAAFLAAAIGCTLMMAMMGGMSHDERQRLALAQ